MISFIIPAHNEELLLGRTLVAVERVGRVMGETFEILVVDDASTDRTADIARELGAHVVSVNCRQIAAVRNAGARAAKGDKFFFIDGDTEPTEAVVRAALDAMKKGAVGGGGGFRFDGKVPFFGKMGSVLLLHFSRIMGLACGCFVFATREAFAACGGFDETLFAAEEWAISRSLRKVGKFVILKEYVITSGRKLRTYSGWEVLGMLAMLTLRGPKMLKKREGLGIWYGQRREEKERILEK
jgi:glycosyltransferase involved in cell wall biosynthesis